MRELALDATMTMSLLETVSRQVETVFHTIPTNG
jgi:hypothetical protein